MTVALIYPHQLFKKHPAIEGVKKVFLIEEPLFFGTDRDWPARMHVQKLVLHRASMQCFAASLSCDFEVLEIGGFKNSIDLLETLPQEISEVKVCELVDNLLEKRVAEFAFKRNLKLTTLATPNFVTPADWGHGYFNSGKKPFMAKFYEAQRKRMGILIENGEPIGGKWSFDEENRKKIPKSLALPSEPVCCDSEFLKEAIQYINALSIEVWGDLDEFIYPLSHQHAEEWFEVFLKERFAQFGTYEDALTKRGQFLFHSVITPMLNIGLLDSSEVVERALKYAEEEVVELNNVEGFVRQVIGWREYMKLMYEKHGTYLRNENFWGFKDSVPSGLYDGNTGILPVDLAVERLKKHGYTHHIERLMVLGNFFMLLRVEPNQVYRWFMEVYIDSYDWVMVPNVYGMSQFSDGGLLVTKPYISGSNYLRKMSDYPAGAWCEAWDSLFWSFVDDHREFFSKQYRMKMMLSHLTKMGEEKLAEHHQRAIAVRETLAAGRRWGDGLLL